VIRFAEVSVGYGGAVGCSRCAPVTRERVYRPVAEIAAEIAAVCGAWEGRLGPNIRLTGAEPIEHPELPSIISAAAAAGCQRIGVDTDGVALGPAGHAAEILVAGVRHVRFTLLGGTAAVHDALAGAPGRFDAALEGARSFRAVSKAEDLATSITALISVCRHNVHDLPLAVLAAVEAGVNSVLLRLDDDGLDMRSLTPWVVAACDTGVVNSVWVEVEGVPRGDLPGYELHVPDAARPIRARKGD